MRALRWLQPKVMLNVAKKLPTCVLPATRPTAAASTLKVENPGQGGANADEATLKRGQQLAERGDWSQYIVSCKSCHGPGNRGAGDVFPGIAGQHAGYIEAQLKAWKEGTRKNDPQDLMGSIARRMSDEDIHAVAVWLANQSAGSK